MNHDLVGELCCYLCGGAFVAIRAVDDVSIKDASGIGLVRVNRHVCPVAKVSEFFCLQF